MRIGLLTGGGDCPGLNAAIRAVVRAAERGHGDRVIGFHHGWRGVAEGDGFPLNSAMTRGIIGQGGTILGTARYHPHEHPGALDAVLQTARHERLDGFVVLGGDGTLDAARYVAAEGVPIVGVPKTIDNDVRGTKACLGFDTAVATVTEAIDRVRTTGESHDRAMVVEVMGRAAGWLAVYAGLAGGADAILIPEQEVDLAATVAGLRRRHEQGSMYSIVVVAEGVRLLVAEDAGAGGLSGSAARLPGSAEGAAPGQRVASAIAAGTGYETRLTVLGHVQRGGPATAADRFLGTRLGVAATDAVHDGATATLVAVAAGAAVCTVDLEVVAKGPRLVPDGLLALVSLLTSGLNPGKTPD
jgi:ATP-dependent phosphofructokinase / diphosphate-dependent phosphofructokinase